MASILTALVSNNAVAVVVKLIDISLVYVSNIYSRLFVVVALVAACANFAPPIGYQIKLLVYGLGCYKFEMLLNLGCR